MNVIRRVFGGPGVLADSELAEPIDDLSYALSFDPAYLGAVQNDYSAVVGIERRCSYRNGAPIAPSEYNVTFAHRGKDRDEAERMLRQAYEVATIKYRPGMVPVLVDVSGTTMWGVRDLINQYPLLFGVTYTGGDTPRWDGSDHWLVPQRILAVTMENLMRNRRLHVDPRLPLKAIMEREVRNFRVRIHPRTGREHYEAGPDLIYEREQPHDDLTFAVAQCLGWWEVGEQAVEPLSDAVINAFISGGSPW